MKLSLSIFPRKATLIHESPAAYQHLSGEECSLLLRFPLRVMSIGRHSVFHCDPISLPLLHQPGRLTNAWSHVEEADTGKNSLMLPVEHRDPPQAASAPSLFVISVRCFPWLKTKAKERMRNMHF